MDIPTLYKITGPAGECLNGGRGTWSLPTATEPGEWWRIAGDISACRNGLHFADASQIATWLPADIATYTVHRAEVDGPAINAGAKWVAGAARLLPRREPMPDITPAAERVIATRDTLRAVRDRAEGPRRRAYDRAQRAYDRAVPASGYLSRIDPRTLPKGHPLAAEAAAFAAATSALMAAQRAADARFMRAVAPAERAAQAASEAYTAAVATVWQGA